MELNLCINCMQEHNVPGPCPHCGFDRAQYSVVYDLLPPETILHGRYLLGRALDRNYLEGTYIGYDLFLDMKVTVREYFPDQVVFRNEAQGLLVSIYNERLYIPYQQGMNAFLNEARRLGSFWKLPGLASVTDVFCENKTAYIITAYSEGETLKERCKKGGNLAILRFKGTGG